MTDPTPLVTARRDALVQALHEVVCLAEDPPTGCGLADALLASGVVRAVDGLAEDLKKFDVQREWDYVLSDAADADASTILSNVQRFLGAHIDRALAAALATPTDPSEA